MAEIAGAVFQAAKFVGETPATGIVSALAGDGTVQVLEKWDPVQGDATHLAPAGSAVGGGTRRHLFDREVYVDSTGGAVYVNVRAWGSITGKPTTVAGYGITDAVTTGGGGTVSATIRVSGGSPWTSSGWTKGIRLDSDVAVEYSSAGANAKYGIANSGGTLYVFSTPAEDVSGAATITTTLTTAAYSIGVTLLPRADNSTDLGDGSFRWRNASLAGTLSVGGNVSVNAGSLMRYYNAAATEVGRVAAVSANLVISNPNAAQNIELQPTAGFIISTGTGIRITAAGAVSAVTTLAITGDFTQSAGGKVGIGAAVDGTAQFLVAGGTSFSTVAKFSRAGGAAATTGSVTLLFSNNGSGSTGADTIWDAVAGTGHVFRVNGATQVLELKMNGTALFHGTGLPAGNTTSVLVNDTNAMAANVGGSIGFGYKYTAAGAFVNAAAAFGAYKINATDGNYATGVKIWVTPNGGGSLQTTAVTITDLAVVSIGNNLLPLVDNSYDLGSASFRWRDLKLSRDLTMAGMLTNTGRISVSGGVGANLISTSANGGYALILENTHATAGWGLEIISASPAGTGYEMVSAYANGVEVFRVYGNGNVQNTNNSYGAISDARAKQDITPAGSQWDDVRALKLRKFRLVTDPDGPAQLGVIAQEVLATSPGLVDGSPDPNSGGAWRYGVKYSVLYMKAVGALQEAMHRIESLEAWAAASGYTVPAFA